MIENKSINGMSYVLGQYMTPIDMTNKLVDKIEITEDTVYIEPSYGTANFIKSLNNKGVDYSDIVGCELDEKLYELSVDLPFKKTNINFYDWKFKTDKKIVFFGNPPFRTPALSLQTHKDFVKKICKKYGVKGIREEAVFFFLRCLEIIEENGKNGEIHFILPQTILTNNSKFYKNFQNLLFEKFDIISSTEIPDGVFESASLKMVFLQLKYKIVQNTNVFVGEDDYWTYTKIFKRTYLGSVPCESIFLSCKEESKEQFRERLIRVYQSSFDELDTNLRHNGFTHLSVLNGENEELKSKKLEVIWSYLEEVRKKIGDSFIEDLSNLDNYKPINHRHEIRYYFRNVKLKKMSFVYEINPNPTKSFYFTGNPSKSSTDYFGYCDYDITRNSSPGACRTIPTEGLEENFTEEFKEWWDRQELGSYENIFNMFVKVSKSQWYKNMKKKFNRFYFGVPKDLLKLK
jgi:hypothetical protein